MVKEEAIWYNRQTSREMARTLAHQKSPTPTQTQKMRTTRSDLRQICVQKTRAYARSARPRLRRTCQYFPRSLSLRPSPVTGNPQNHPRTRSRSLSKAAPRHLRPQGTRKFRNQRRPLSQRRQSPPSRPSLQRQCPRARATWVTPELRHYPRSQNLRRRLERKRCGKSE